MRYILIEDERFPTLTLDDCSWRGDPMGSEPPGHYPYEAYVEVSDALYERWEAATKELKAVEGEIRALDWVVNLPQGAARKESNA